MFATIMTVLEAICKRLRKSQRKTLASLVESLLLGRRASLADIARGMGKRTSFAGRLKRVWRYVGNERLEPQRLGEDVLRWFIEQLQPGEPLVLLVDWSKFDRHHVLLAAVPVERRAVPVVWEIITDRERGGGQNSIEYRFFEALRALLPPAITPIIVADRGFGRTELFKKLDRLGMGYIIRIREEVWVEKERWQGVLANYPLKVGQIIHWERVSYHKDKRYSLNLVMRRQRLNHQSPKWYLATNVPAQAVELLELYEKRVWIEEMFRDLKSAHFQLDSTRLSSPQRRSRLLIAIALATLLASFIGQYQRREGLLPEANGQKAFLGLNILRMGMEALKQLGNTILKQVWLPLIAPAP